MERLTTEILNAWLEAATAADLPIVKHLGPGLSDAELDALEVELGHRLSDEIRTFWGWRAMVSPGPSAARIEFELTTGWQLVGPAHHVESSRKWARDAYPEYAPGQGLFTPLATPSLIDLLYTDYSTLRQDGELEFAPVLGNPEHGELVVVAPSLANLFQRWTAHLRAGGPWIEDGEWTDYAWEHLDDGLYAGDFSYDPLGEGGA